MINRVRGIAWQIEIPTDDKPLAIPRVVCKFNKKGWLACGKRARDTLYYFRCTRLEHDFVNPINDIIIQRRLNHYFAVTTPYRCPRLITLDRTQRFNFNVRLLDEHGVDTNDQSCIAILKDKPWSPASYVTSSFTIVLDIQEPCAVEWTINSFNFTIKGIQMFSIQIGNVVAYNQVWHMSG